MTKLLTLLKKKKFLIFTLKIGLGFLDEGLWDKMTGTFFCYFLTFLSHKQIGVHPLQKKLLSMHLSNENAQFFRFVFANLRLSSNYSEESFVSIWFWQVDWKFCKSHLTTLDRSQRRQNKNIFNWNCFVLEGNRMQLIILKWNSASLWCWGIWCALLNSTRAGFSSSFQPSLILVETIDFK